MEKKPAEKAPRYVMRLGRGRAVAALIMCAVVVIAVLATVTIMLLQNPSQTYPERREKTFHLFTAFSNLVCAAGAAACIPFAVEGIRKGRFSVPRWATMLFYSGTISVTITFIFAVLFIGPFKGYDFAFGGTNLWLHGVCPVLSLFVFIVLESGHKIRTGEVYLALLPFFLYAMEYTYNVVFVGEAYGGWRDVYQLNTKVPAWVSLPLMFGMAICVAMLLRAAHNAVCAKRDKSAAKATIRFSKLPEDFTIEDAVRQIAAQETLTMDINEVTVHLDLLQGLRDRFNSDLSISELADLYVDASFAKKQQMIAEQMKRDEELAAKVEARNNARKSARAERLRKRAEKLSKRAEDMVPKDK